MFFPSRCLTAAINQLNRVTLVGAVHEIQTGFLGSSSVFQFTLTCSTLESEKEQYCVRCIGDEAYTEALKTSLDDGTIVRVMGRMKTIETGEGSTNGKKHRYSFVMVDEDRGDIALLHSVRKQRNDSYLRHLLSEAKQRVKPHPEPNS